MEHHCIVGVKLLLLLFMVVCMLVSVMGVLKNNLISIQLWKMKKFLFVRFEILFVCFVNVESKITFVGGFCE